MDNPQVKITPFNNPEAFEELETGYLTLNLTLKPLNSKYGLKTINHLQSLLKEKDMEKVLINSLFCYLLPL